MKTNKKWLLSFWEGCLKWCVFHIPVGCSGNELAELEVVCLRDRSRKGEREITHSLVLSVKLTSVAELAGRFSGPSQMARKSCCPWCSMWPSCWAVQWNWFARVNALCNLLRKKSPEVALSLPGQFLSRRCFMLCITMEVEPRIAKQYKCHRCYSCKNYHGERGWKVEKKCLCIVFLADQNIAISWKKCILGHPIAQAASYCLLPDAFWLRACKNVFKVGSIKFANSLSPPSIVKKVHTGSKSSQGT